MTCEKCKRPTDGMLRPSGVRIPRCRVCTYPKRWAYCSECGDERSAKAAHCWRCRIFVLRMIEKGKLTIRLARVQMDLDVFAPAPRRKEKEDARLSDAAGYGESPEARGGDGSGAQGIQGVQRGVVADPQETQPPPERTHPHGSPSERDERIAQGTADHAPLSPSLPTRGSA